MTNPTPDLAPARLSLLRTRHATALAGLCVALAFVGRAFDRQVDWLFWVAGIFAVLAIIGLLRTRSRERTARGE